MFMRMWLIALLLFQTTHLMASQKDNFKNEQFPKDMDIAQRNYMIEISRQIGVTCTYCHNLKDFKSQEKSAYKISKDHIEFVKAVNGSLTNKLGKKMDCYMCHRGQAKPDYKEKHSIFNPNKND